MSTRHKSDGEADATAADAVTPFGSRYVDSETFDCGDADPCTRLIRRAAGFAGVDPLNADDTLHDAVDVAAVERMFDDRHAGDYRLSFRLFGCEVDLRSDGRATVYRLPVD